MTSCSGTFISRHTNSAAAAATVGQQQQQHTHTYIYIYYISTAVCVLYKIYVYTHICMCTDICAIKQPQNKLSPKTALQKLNAKLNHRVRRGGRERETDKTQQQQLLNGMTNKLVIQFAGHE